MVQVCNKLERKEMSVHVHKIDGKVDSIHLYGDDLKEIINIIDQLWCDFALQETKVKYATDWPKGYGAIKQLLKELY